MFGLFYLLAASLLKRDHVGVKKASLIRVRYRLLAGQSAEHGRELAHACDLLFEEVLRIRSTVGSVDTSVTPADSTPTGSR
jgi:hypothetical protein